MIQSLSESTSLALSIAPGLQDRLVIKLVANDSSVKGRTAPSSVTSSQSVENQDLEEAVAQVQEALHQGQSRVQLSVDNELNKVVVKVVDKDSGELIRQFPPEEFLRVQRFLKEHSGLLLTEEA